MCKKVPVSLGCFMRGKKKPETVLYGKITEELQRCAKGRDRVRPIENLRRMLQRVFARQNFRFRRFVKRTEKYPIRSRFVRTITSCRTRVRNWIDAPGFGDPQRFFQGWFGIEDIDVRKKKKSLKKYVHCFSTTNVCTQYSSPITIN